MTPLEISLLIISVFFIGYSLYLLWRIRDNGYELEKCKEDLQDEYDKLSEDHTELLVKYDRLVGTNAANAKWKNKFEEQRDKAIERIGELDNLVGKYDDENRQLKEQLEGKNKVVKTVRKQGEKKAVKRTVKK